jgi:hypothetical protein
MPGPVVLAGSGRLGRTLAGITAGAAVHDAAGADGQSHVAALVYDATELESPAGLRDRCANSPQGSAAPPCPWTSPRS